jgi:hypothetical protein
MEGGELLWLCILLLQSLGIMLGVGAQSILLCAHLVSLHRHEAESAEDPFARAIRAAQGVSLPLIIISGAAAVVLHLSSGQAAVLAEPSFLFKWIVIALVLGLFLWQGGRQFSGVRMGITGGVWYALFMLHSLGPVTTWESLVVMFALWMVFFGLVWAGFVAVLRGVHATASAPARPISLPTLPPKPQLPLVIQKPPQPKPVQVSVPPKSVPIPPPPKPELGPVAPVVHQPPVVPVIKVIKKEAKAPVLAPAPKKESWLHRMLMWFVKPAPAARPPAQPVVQAPLPPLPPPPPLPKPEPPKPIEPVEPLPVPPPPAPVPVKVAPPPPPKPVAPPFLAVPKPLVQKPEAPTLLEHDEPLLPQPQQGPVQEQDKAAAGTSLPGLRIMPQRPEDIANEHRPAILKP